LGETLDASGEAHDNRTQNMKGSAKLKGKASGGTTDEALTEKGNCAQKAVKEGDQKKIKKKNKEWAGRSNAGPEGAIEKKRRRNSPGPDRGGAITE